MTTTQWTHGAGTSSWTNPANWSNGAPDATTDVIMGGVSNANCSGGSNSPCKSIDCTGYSGALTINNGFGGCTIIAYGDVTLASTIASSVTQIVVQFAASGTLTCNGYQKVSVRLNGGASGITVSFGDDATIKNIIWSENAVNTLAFGAHTITCGIGVGGGITWTGGGRMTHSPGAKLVIANGGGGGGSNTTTWTSSDTGYSPPVESAVDVSASAGWRCASWTQTAGTISGSGSIVCQGDFTLTGSAAMTGAHVQAGGDAGGTTTGAITTTTFAGGNALYVPNAVDGGGNTNVFFTVAPPHVTGPSGDLMIF